MEYVIGILLLVSFFGLVVYAVRGGNLMLGIFVMGVIWTVLPMIGNTFATNPDFIAANKDAVPGLRHWKRRFRVVRKDGERHL